MLLFTVFSSWGNWPCSTLASGNIVTETKTFNIDCRELYNNAICSLFCCPNWIKNIYIFPNKRKKGKIILLSGVSVTGESTIKALGEFSTGKHKKKIRRKWSYFYKYSNSCPFFFFHCLINIVAIDLFLKIDQCSTLETKSARKAGVDTPWRQEGSYLWFLFIL